MVILNSVDERKYIYLVKSGKHIIIKLLTTNALNWIRKYSKLLLLLFLSKYLKRIVAKGIEEVLHCGVLSKNI